MNTTFSHFASSQNETINLAISFFYSLLAQTKHDLHSVSWEYISHGYWEEEGDPRTRLRLK
jgi:hypothetical protein